MVGGVHGVKRGQASLNRAKGVRIVYGGNRFYLVGGYFTNGKIAGIVRGNKEYEKLLGDKLPSQELIASSDDFPDDHWKFDSSKSRRVLGLDYVSLEKSVLDTVESIVKFKGQ